MLKVRLGTTWALAGLLVALGACSDSGPGSAPLDGSVDGQGADFGASNLEAGVASDAGGAAGGDAAADAPDAGAAADADADADAGCVPSEPMVVGEYLLVVRSSNVSNFGDVVVLRIKPNGSLEEIWSREGVDPVQLLAIPRGGFFLFIDELRFALHSYRIVAADKMVTPMDSITVSDQDGFKVNIRGIAHDEAAGTLTTYNNNMAGWYATEFDFDKGRLLSPSRSFTGLESYLDPFDGYSGRFGENLAYDSTEAYSYSVQDGGIAIADKASDGPYVLRSNHALSAMQYALSAASVQSMQVMSSGVSCD